MDDIKIVPFIGRHYLLTVDINGETVRVCTQYSKSGLVELRRGPVAGEYFAYCDGLRYCDAIAALKQASDEGNGLEWCL
jgi:hypothetical protein